jgi:hypothetical protein
MTLDRQLLMKWTAENQTIPSQHSLDLLFDGVNDPPENEHPMTAAGIVLLCAAFRMSTDIDELAELTGYSIDFVLAIAFNMENNKLWVNGEYSSPQWWLGDGCIDEEEFWQHIDAACGDLWFPEGDSRVSAHPCEIYWNERPLQAP